MKRFNEKETIGSYRQCLTRSKKRDEEEAADEKDLISSLPVDLKLQILSKLPPKSVAKLISVSKLWLSIVRAKDLTDLFISRSSTRPSFLFTLGTPSIRRFHSRSQEEPSSSGNRGTSIITPNPILGLSPPVRGLVCGSEVICNPSTGQFVSLPKILSNSSTKSNFLGYDPVNDVYKVLCLMVPYLPHYHGPVVSVKHQVFTLGATQKAWRTIECKHSHCPATKELCRDGVVYYGAWCNSHHERSLIVSFDLSSEDFGVIKLPEDVKIRQFQTELVNYHGKITLVDRSTTGNFDLWVLQDVEKEEWSKISVLLPDIAGSNVFYCKGTINTGEIIFAPSQYANPFFLLYYYLVGNDVIRVDIEGVRDSGDNGPITVFVHHVESPMFLQKED